MRPMTVLRMRVLDFLVCSSLPPAVVYMIPATTKAPVANTPAPIMRVVRINLRANIIPSPLVPSHQLCGRIEVVQLAYAAVRGMRVKVQARAITANRRKISFFMG